MKLRNCIWLLFVMAFACAKKDNAKKISPSPMEVSAVYIQFNDDLPEDVRAKAQRYHLEIVSLQENCKTERTSNRINEKGEWLPGKKLMLSAKLARGCEYNLRLKFGEVIDSREIWYLSNHKIEDGDPVGVDGQRFKTEGAITTPIVKVCLTARGEAIGLHSFINCAKSELLTHVGITVNFGEALSPE